MKKIIIFTILSTVIYLEAFSQVNLNNQVIVYFATGVQRIAPANTTCNITSTNILNALNNYGIPNSNVIPSFPTFNESDTVNTELGEISRQMNKLKYLQLPLQMQQLKQISL